MSNGVDFKKMALDNRDQLNAALSRESSLREELERVRSRYDRDVLGLNNEGDPIGGDPAGGYKNDNARLQRRLSVAENRAERFEALMLESNELLYVIQDGLGAHLSSAVDEVRGKVFTALKTVESISHEIPGTSGMRLNMLANQGE